MILDQISQFSKLEPDVLVQQLDIISDIKDLPGNHALCKSVSQDSQKFKKNCASCINSGYVTRDYVFCQLFDHYYDYDRANYCDDYKKLRGR